MSTNNEKVRFEKVALIEMLRSDNATKSCIPLYVKIASDALQEQINEITHLANEYIKKYEKNIREYFQDMKEEQERYDFFNDNTQQQEEQRDIVRYERIAGIGILNKDDSLKMLINLYVKVFGKMSKRQEQLIQDISSIFVRHYEPQISEHFAKLRNEQQQGFDKQK